MVAKFRYTKGRSGILRSFVETIESYKMQELALQVEMRYIQGMEQEINKNPAQLIRIGALAKLTGVPVSHIRRLADEGRISAFRVDAGRHRRFVCDQAIQQVRCVMNLR